MPMFTIKITGEIAVQAPDLESAEEFARESLAEDPGAFADFEVQAEPMVWDDPGSVTDPGGADVLVLPDRRGGRDV